MRCLCVTLCATSMAAAAPAALANPELARSKICMGCHDVKEKKIGPLFKDVAVRYAGQKDAAPRLADKVVRGGAGGLGRAADARQPQGLAGRSATVGGLDPDAQVARSPV
jgi:cytochrome c